MITKQKKEVKLDSFSHDSKVGQQVYPLTREITGIVGVELDGKPVNYHVTITLVRPPQKYGELKIITLPRKDL